MHNEVWKAVVGFEGFYEVSNLGQVKSLSRIVRCFRHRQPASRKIKGRIRKLPLNKQGYPTITLTAKGRRKCVHVHILVLTAFVGPCPEGMECCHGDGIKPNCRLDNLRWDTKQNNVLDQDKHGTRRRGEDAVWTKVTEPQVIEIRQSKLSALRIAKIYGIGPTQVKRIRNRESWSHVK